jgi:mono/diheme cytochrome c family protein
MRTTVLGWLAGIGLLALPLTAAELEIDFTRDIRPLLSANCFACHGPDDQAREGDLRLDTQAGAQADHAGTRAIVPGRPEASELIARINSTDPDLVMPPPKTGHKLTAAQRELLARWIKEGGVYTQHWSFRPLARPTPPAVTAAPEQVRNPIDRFVLARLAKEKLQPEAQADPYTLLRRVSLDLIGLPPTLAEAEAFAQDASNEAYEKFVDRLLHSPHFGEHWARMWLDLARYADTKGYEKDQPRQIWRYRDWVIDAFNADLPYDQFTIEQLAGDLLPSATPSQMLATAFHRNTMTNDEGGTDNEEFRVAAVKDRVNTTLQVWMGLTAGCANCHTHKYDPITQQDYYRFYALFNQTEDADRPDDSPTLAIPTAEQAAQIAELEEQVKQRRADFWKPLTAEQTKEQEAWEAGLARQIGWQPLKAESALSKKDATLAIQPDGAILVSDKHAETDVVTLAAPFSRKKITAIRLEALTHASLPKQGPGRHKPDPNFVVSEFSVRLDAADSALKLANPRADFSQQGWEVAKAIDGDGATGWAISPQQGKAHVAIFELVEPLTVESGKLVIKLVQNYPFLQLGHFRLSVTDADPKKLKPELASLSELALIERAKRSAEQQRMLDQAFREQQADFGAIHKQIAASEAELKAIQQQIPKTPIFRELPADKGRVTRIHQRGNFLEPGDTVEPAVLTTFARLPPEAPLNRLGAAKWLVSQENPLTPRVAVNRLWARMFGVGLVETEEDFGLQGASPSNPELLDWLATEFRDTHGWSWKKLCKTIVMSATYRQASRVTPEKLAADPKNVLLSRGARFRLSGETIRDQSLAVSGLLSPKLGGPSVMPPQPPGLWKAAYSSLKWETSPGEDRYRRALYTFARRTSPYPALMTFDAGSGEICLVRRIRTNTPLAALVTLNDPAFFEMHGALAKRMLTEGGSSVRERATHGFRLALLRPPTPKELERAEAVIEQTRAEFQKDAAAAKRLLESANLKPTDEAANAELAAWTVFGNVLLNLDEFLTKP